jgi:hypothetical protein
VIETRELEDRLRHVLHQAADQVSVTAPDWQAARAGRPPWGPRLAQHLGAVAAVALAALAVLVSVGGIVLLGRHHTSRPVARPPAVASSRTTLISILGVLRRPQTPADLDLPQLPQLERNAPNTLPLHGPVDLPLVRFAGRTPWGQKIFLVPYKPPTRIQIQGNRRRVLGLLNRARSLGEWLEIVTPGLVPDLGANAHQIQTEGDLAEAVVGCQKPSGRCPGALRFVGVVPDGVARVGVSVAATATAEVHQNVFAVQLPVLPSSALATGPIFTWYSASGQVIKRIGPNGTVIPTGPTGGARRKPRPLPAALVRSFDVFRGLASNQARFVTNVDREELFVVPQTKQVCLIERHSPIAVIRERTAGSPLRGDGGGGDCVPNDMALAGEMSPITGGPAGVTVTGLAPNGNRTVRLVRADGSSEIVPVQNNIYIAHDAHGFQTVTLKDSNGAVRTWNVPDGGG